MDHLLFFMIASHCFSRKTDLPLGKIIKIAAALPKAIKTTLNLKSASDKLWIRWLISFYECEQFVSRLTSSSLYSSTWFVNKHDELLTSMTRVELKIISGTENQINFCGRFGFIWESKVYVFQRIFDLYNETRRELPKFLPAVNPKDENNSKSFNRIREFRPRQMGKKTISWRHNVHILRIVKL